MRSSKLSSVTLLQSSNGRRELLEQQQHQQRLSTSDYAHGDEASQQKLINGTRLIDMVFRSLKHIGDFTDALIDMVTFPELFEYLHVFLAFIAGDWPVYFQVRRMASSTGDDLVLTILTRPAFADACNRADIGADENDKRLQFAHAVVDRIRNVLAVPGPLHMSLNGTETCGKLLAFVLRDAFKQAHSGKDFACESDCMGDTAYDCTFGNGMECDERRNMHNSSKSRKTYESIVDCISDLDG